MGKVCKDYQLLKGKDPIKDQTYFVYRLTQDQLKKCIFPVGDYVKSDLREMARKVNLPTAERRDSQGICFIGNINVKSFLKTRLPDKEGDIVICKACKDEIALLEAEINRRNKKIIKQRKLHGLQ